MGAIYLTGRKGDKLSPRNESHGIMVNRGASGLCWPIMEVLPGLRSMAWRSGPEELSARVGNSALGTAELVEFAAPVGSALDVERAVPMAAAVLVGWSGAEWRCSGIDSYAGSWSNIGGSWQRRW